MPRKSQALRLQQAENLLTVYTESNMTGTSKNFISDMVSKMKRGKYPTKRQRDWLDKLIGEGVPQPKGDIELVGKIDEAIKFWSGSTKRMWEQGVLLDLRRVVYNDWKMSDKQRRLLDNILDKHQGDVTGTNVFHPTESQHNDLVALTKLYNSYARMWKSERPALAKAVVAVIAYLAGNDTIEEYHYNKLTNAMSSKLKKFKSPRFSTGDAGFVWNASTKVMVLCASDVYINERGVIVNDWVMPTGALETLDQERVSKR